MVLIDFAEKHQAVPQALRSRKVSGRDGKVPVQHGFGRDFPLPRFETPLDRLDDGLPLHQRNYFVVTAMQDPKSRCMIIFFLKSGVRKLGRSDLK